MGAAAKGEGIALVNSEGLNVKPHEQSKGGSTFSLLDFHQVAESGQ
jgi:hypothetical protein